MDDMIKRQPEIVLRAFNDGITDIGQLSKDDIKLLKKAVKQGILWIVPDFSYPTRKRKYVMNFENYDILTGEYRGEKNVFKRNK